MFFAMTLVLGTLQLHGPLVVWNNLEFALCVSQDEILTLLCFVVLITLGPCESIYVFCPESNGFSDLCTQGSCMHCENVMALPPVEGNLKHS